MADEPSWPLASLAAPIVTGLVPYMFENFTRACEPSIVEVTRNRNVRSTPPLFSPDERAFVIEAPHAPTQIDFEDAEGAIGAGCVLIPDPHPVRRHKSCSTTAMWQILDWTLLIMGLR